MLSPGSLLALWVGAFDSLCGLWGRGASGAGMVLVVSVHVLADFEVTMGASVRIK